MDAATILDLLKKRAFPTAGICSRLDELGFRHYSQMWRGSEFVTYRVPSFDREVIGDWTEGELRIVRRDAEET